MHGGLCSERTCCQTNLTPESIPNPTGGIPGRGSGIAHQCKQPSAITLVGLQMTDLVLVAGGLAAHMTRGSHQCCSHMPSFV